MPLESAPQFLILLNCILLPGGEMYGLAVFAEMCKMSFTRRITAASKGKKLMIRVVR